MKLPCGSRARLGIVFGGLTLLAFWRPLLLGEALFDRDVHGVWYAQTEVLVRTVSEGSWPTWDRTVGFGHPLPANSNRQVFYPPNWINLLLPPWLAYTVLSVFHVLLGALGGYRLARARGASREAGTVAGGLFLVSGPLLSFVAVWHHLAGSAWMPWVLLAAHRALRLGGARRVVAWGLAAALQVFAGSPDLCVITTVGVALLLAETLASQARVEFPRTVARAVAAGATALAVGAAQWLPSLALAWASDRASLDPANRTVWSVEPLLLPQFLAPISYEGLPGHLPALAGERLFVWMPFMRSLYLGAAGVGLVAAGAVTATRRAWWPVAFGLVAGVLSLGHYTPLYAWASAVVPGLAMLRYPSKWTIGVALAWALLAGAGFDAWRAGASRLRLRSLVVGAVVASWLAATLLWIMALWPASVVPGWIADCLADRAALLASASVLALGAGAALLLPWSGTSRPWRLAVAAALALADPALVHVGFNPSVDRSLMASRPETLDVVGTGPLERLYVWDYAPAAHSGDRGGVGLSAFLEVGGRWPALVRRAAAMQMYLYPPIAGRWGLAGSFDRDLLGLYPTYLKRLNLLSRQVEGTPAFGRLLAVAGVNHVVSLHDERDEGLRPVAEIPGFLSRPIRIFAVPEPLPRAYAVGGVQVADGDRALALLVSGGFDPRHEIVLPDGEAAPAARDFQARVDLVDYRADRVELTARLSAPGYVVLLDAWHPGWRASVDGEPVDVLRANVGFRAVRAAAGTHTVVLRYAPRPLAWGLVLTALGLIAAALAWSGARRRGAPDSDEAVRR